MPSFKMALAQVFIGGADILMASLVLYFALIAFVDIPFDTFIGVFIIAQVLGVFSQVPGGLGVFETLFSALSCEISGTKLLLFSGIMIISGVLFSSGAEI